MAEQRREAMGDGEVKFSSLNGVMQGMLILLSIVGIIVPVTLGFVNFDKRLDINEKTTEDHIGKDEAKWVRVDEDIDDLKDNVHSLELTDKELTIHYTEILRRFDEISEGNQRIMDRLETFEAQSTGK